MAEDVRHMELAPDLNLKIEEENIEGRDRNERYCVSVCINIETDVYVYLWREGGFRRRLRVLDKCLWHGQELPRKIEMEHGRSV